MAFAGDSYLCVADLATGFSYNKNLDKWEIVRFKADDSKYIVSKSKSEKWAWEIKEIGESKPISWCTNGFDKNGWLHCEGFINLDMNKQNLRFIEANMFGYVYYGIKDEKGKNVFPKGFGTPNIEIGKCSPLP